MKELGNGRLKQHAMLWGIVIIPVIQPDWFKRFVKVKDIYFFITTGSFTEWSANIHEALIIGLYSPILRNQPCSRSLLIIRCSPILMA